MSDGLIAILVLVGYFLIGPILNGLMHGYDPKTFDNSETSVALVVFWWPLVVPLYWFAIYCDRCICWFEKKKK